MIYPGRYLAASAWVVICGCATSSTPPSDGSSVDRVRISGSGDPGDISFRSAGPSSSSATLEFPAQRVWSLLPSVYSVLSIPIAGIDSAGQRIVGNVSARRSFRGQPVSNMLDCGRSLTGSNADYYSVNIRLTTRVDANGTDASRVRTIVDATGTSTAGATIRCTSTGDLELQILTRLREGLSRQGSIS